MKDEYDSWNGKVDGKPPTLSKGLVTGNLFSIGLNSSLHDTNICMFPYVVLWTLLFWKKYMITRVLRYWIY